MSGNGEDAGLMLCIDESASGNYCMPASLNHELEGTKQIKAPLLARVFAHLVSGLEYKGSFEYGGNSEGCTYGASTSFTAMNLVKKDRFEVDCELNVFPPNFTQMWADSGQCSASFGTCEEEPPCYHWKQIRDVVDPTVTKQELAFRRNWHSNGDDRQGIFFYFDGGVLRMMSGIDYIADKFPREQIDPLREHFNKTFRAHHIMPTGISFINTHASEWAGIKLDLSGQDELREGLGQMEFITAGAD